MKIERGRNTMAGKFVFKKFADIDILDPFFDSLKKDYPGNDNSTGFSEWFKAKADRTALVFEDEEGIAAFIALKKEDEEIKLLNNNLEKACRIKVSTIKISERHRGQRYGEGAIGLMLWYWQKSKINEIYVTVFEKHKGLITELEKFGFFNVGKNLNGENVYIKDRRDINYNNPYCSFPFIKSGFDFSGYILINANYHDNMFAYSDLKNKTNLDLKVGNSVRNGLSKIYIGKAPNIDYKIGEPVLIYRIDENNNPGKKYRSCITSYAVVTGIMQPKRNGKIIIPFDELIEQIGNKSVFDEIELKKKYNDYYNVTVIELLYYGYFGAGHNVNLDWLERNGYWTRMSNQYPTSVHLTEEQFKSILMEGDVDVSNVIIN